MKYTYRHIRLAIVATIATIVISACSEPLNIDYIDTTPLVAVKAINEVDSTFALRLTYSRWFLDNHPFKEVENADVTLSVNGNKVGNATPTTISEMKYYVVNNYSPKENDNLHLSIQVPEYDEITAECKVPQRPLISDMHIEEIIYTSEYNDYNYITDSSFTVKDTSRCEYIVSFTLHDNPGEQNYYVISAMSKEMDGIRPHYISVEDYVLYEEMSSIIDVIDGGVYSVREFMFSDSKINGKDYTVKISFEDYQPISYYDETIFTISAISPDLYYYLLTIEKEENSIDLFGEPIQIHCNIENGAGILGVMAPTQKQIVPDVTTVKEEETTYW